VRAIQVGGRLLLAAGMLLAAAVLLAAPGRHASAGDKLEAARQKYRVAAHKNLVECGAAHIKLGIWARDAGLPVQATAEFLRAEELAGPEMPIAGRIVSIMRTYGDKFWKGVQKKPVALLRTYENKARDIEDAATKDRLRLGKDAASWGLVEESYAEYVAAVRMTDAPLAFDAKGQVILPVAILPPDVSARMKAEAIAINDKLYLRDEFLEAIPDVKTIAESDGVRVRVRTMGGTTEAEDVRRIVEAVLDAIENDLGGRPTRKLQVFVFKEAGPWGAWLRASKQEAFAVATGLADGRTFTALVNGTGLSPETIRRVALHEVAHLFMYGVTPAVMPSWYSEGFADAYGGSGTFTWDGKTLVSGGTLEPSLLAEVKTDAGYLPLAELVGGNALSLLQTDKPRASRFYAESWAFLRFLRTGAPAAVRDRFALWELACRGGAIGAKAGRARERDTAPAEASFGQAFPDLPVIEKAFVAWLRAL
jgi:hypothetical protein